MLLFVKTWRFLKIKFTLFSDFSNKVRQTDCYICDGTRKATLTPQENTL